MAKLKTPEAVEAWEEVMQYSPKASLKPPGVRYEDRAERFKKAVDTLIREVQNETELALMRGETRHLGEKHMLITSIYQALSLCCRPVHREAAFAIVKEALDTYLATAFPDPPKRRQRRNLLPHV